MVPFSTLCINYSLAGTYKVSVHLLQSGCRLNEGNKSILFYSILFYYILFYYILFYSILFYSILIHLWLDELWLEELDEVVWEDAHPPLQLTLPPPLVLHIPANRENFYNSVAISCVADPGCLTRIRDPNFFHPRSRRSRIRIFPSRISDSHQRI